jgi:hypothetical protein
MAKLPRAVAQASAIEELNQFRYASSASAWKQRL